MKKNSNSDYYNIPLFLDSRIKLTLITAVLYFSIAKLSRVVIMPEVNLAPFFPAAGFAVAAVLIFGRKALLGLLIGSFMFSTSLFFPDFQKANTFIAYSNIVFYCLTRAIMTVLNAYITYYTTQLLCKTRYPFNKGIHVLYFTLACLTGSIISVTLGILPLALTSYITMENFLLMWSNWFRGNVLGSILFAPFVLAWMHKTEEAVKWPLSKKAEGLFLSILTILISIYIFETKANNESLIIFVLIWAAYRFGIKAISLLALIITAIAVYCTSHNMGGFSNNGWNDNFFMLQLFLFVNMVSIMFLRGILEENEKKKSKLILNEKKLNLKKNLLQATIESPNGISIFSLDNCSNYLSFNSAHKAYMKNEYGAAIKVGDNYIECIATSPKKEAIVKQIGYALSGNTLSYEEKNSFGDFWNVTLSPIQNSQSEVIGTTTIVTNISDLKLKEIQLEKNNYDLNERIKEITCLYNILKVHSNDTKSRKELIQIYAQNIPAGFQFPEITNCRITIKGEESITDKLQETNWSLHKTITVNGTAYGEIEVGFFLGKEANHTFLSEELQLLDTISNILSKSLESNLAEESLTKSEENYRILFENVQDVFFKTSIKTKEILDVSPSCSNFNGITREELIGQNMSIIYPDKAAANIMFQKIVSEQQIIDYSNEIEINGQKFYVSINAKIIYDANGEPNLVVGALRDITERRLTEKNLQESEENYRTLFENVQDVFFKTSLRTDTILEVSPSCSSFNGIKREELIGQSIFAIYPDTQQLEQMTEKLAMEGKIIDFNNEIIIKNQSYFVSINAKVVFDADGKPEYLIGALRDITKRRLAEENLKISEEKFRSIYENLEDIYFKKDLNGVFIDISPSIEKHFHLTREYMIGTNCHDFHYDRENAVRFFEIIRRDKKINDYEERFVTAAGEIIYFSVNARLVHNSNGEPDYIEGTMRNVNDRINNQKQLLDAAEKTKESEEKFRSIYENMLDVYFIQDLEGRILDLSPSVEKHFDVKREEVIGQYVKTFYYDPARYDELAAKIYQKGSFIDEQVQYITPKGEIVYFSVNTRLIYDDNGIPIRAEGSMRNINERITNQQKLAEAAEKIKQSEEEFRSIFESFEDLYYKTSIDGIIQKVSPSVEKILKYKTEEVVNTDVNNLYFYPEGRTKIIALLKENGYVNDIETVFKDKDGCPIHLSLNARIVYDAQGNPTHTEGTLRDISERKKNEQQIAIANETIKDSEKKYRTIFESVRDVFFRASAKDHTIIDISPSCSYFDLKPEEAIGSKITDFYFNPNDRLTVLEELMTNGEIKNHDVKMLINTKIYTVSVSSKIIFDQNNDPEYIIGSIHDITDRIEAQENLKISEEKFRTIYENFEDVYFRTALDGTVLDVSPSFEKHFHKPCSEALGSSVFDFYFDKKDRTLLLEKMQKQGNVSDFDALFKDTQGNVLFFSVNASFVYDANGIPVNIEGTMRNINERRVMQEDMIAKNKKLEFQNTELEQFAYIASHDLQEPLITVIHCAELLQEELAEKLEEDQKQYLNFINSSTSRMQLLVKGLLDYSRIGKERKTDRIDCNEIVDNVLSDMNASVKESDALIEYENLPRIEGNATEMRQLFQNMISNAIKFRKKGHKPKVKITAVQEEENWLFSIADNGIGIEKENMTKVFVIFKRLNNRSDYQGTGIGLSHCKKIIEQHHGKIWVESKFNEGTTFKWTLPLN
jgi:PAS domain S-box-containing protein